MKEKLKNIISSNGIYIPIYMIEIKDALKLEGDLFIFLMYLESFGNNQVLDLEKYSKDFNKELTEVLTMIDSLKKLDLIEIKMTKNAKGINEERVLFDSFYDKVVLYIMSKDDIKENNQNIHKIIEAEFGRTISPMEWEKINSFVEKYSDELIIEAIKEAVFNGALNINYISKILYEWHKKGYKGRIDVEKGKEEFREAKKLKEVEMIDYDWFSENN